MDGTREARAINIQVVSYRSRSIKDYARNPAVLDLHVEIVGCQHFDPGEMAFEKLRDFVRVDVESDRTFRSHLFIFDAGFISQNV
jgi:hypothetical protein